MPAMESRHILTISRKNNNLKPKDEAVAKCIIKHNRTISHNKIRFGEREAWWVQTAELYYNQLITV